MSIVDRWLLPDGVEDVLPPEALRLEAARRCLLDLFASWGYDYVIPPMVEFLESLLTGTGRDLDLKTFKVVDLLTGRSMGVRADITPQVARIDAHSLNQPGVTRLCYAGTVVQSQADSQLGSRIPLSVGAELFGDSSSRGDVEIVSLMVESLRALGLNGTHLDLGDVAIFRQLLDSLDLSEYQQELLFDTVQRKALGEIRRHASAFSLSSAQTEVLCSLPGLTGDMAVLEEARTLFKDYPGILSCIENLQSVATAVSERFPELDVYFDLSELRGYAYHTGIVFAAYVDGISQIVAKGGRYDDIGQVFGRSDRSATGFSINVRSLLEQASLETGGHKRVIVQPGTEESSALFAEMQRLRNEGYVVMESGESADFILFLEDGSWQLQPGD
jgi:ATP phosphoribosyltransferase regulatory subunit